MRHTRYGFWLEDAGLVEPTLPLAADATADVIIVGGGYLGLWTAWQLKTLEPALDVVAFRCRTRRPRAERTERRLRLDPLGRPADPPRSRRRHSRGGGVSGLRASRARDRCPCAAEGVDAWFVSAPTLYVATSDAQVGDWDEIVHGMRGGGCSRRGPSHSMRAPSARGVHLLLFRGGGLLLRQRPLFPGAPVSRTPRRAIAKGVGLYERTRVTRARSGCDCSNRFRAHAEGRSSCPRSQ